MMMMMQQLSEPPKQKNSLFNAMNRFIGAVNNMDQTIMVPSMLRDVPLDADADMSALKSDVDDGDMYSYYQLLKSIRRDIEWGVRRAAADERRAAADERRAGSLKVARTHSSASVCSSASSSSSSSSSSEEEEEEEDEEDLEKQFQFHLTGLQGVLSKLTRQADSLTRCYKKEIGIGGWGQ